MVNVASHAIRTFHGGDDDGSEDSLDALLGIDASSIERSLDLRGVINAAGKNNFVYGGTAFCALRDLFHRLTLTADDVFYDLGCGYGRVLLYGALVAPARFRGVELLPERVAHATTAAANLGLANRVDVRTGDVVHAPIDDGTVYFMYHPFYQTVLPNVVAALERIAAAKLIRIATIFYGDDSFRGQPWLHEIDPPTSVVQAGAFTRIYTSVNHT